MNENDDRWTAPVVELTVSTRHPQDYLLINEEDGTVWRASANGNWKREGHIAREKSVREILD